VLDRPIVLVYVDVYAHKFYKNIAMGLLRVNWAVIFVNETLVFFRGHI
jgi:hypothetical protein